MVSLALPNIERKVNTNSSQTLAKKKKRFSWGYVYSVHWWIGEGDKEHQEKAVTGELGILALNRNLFLYSGLLY